MIPKSRIKIINCDCQSVLCICHKNFDTMIHRDYCLPNMQKGIAD